MTEKHANWSMEVEIMSQLHTIHYPAFVWNSRVFGRLCACSLLSFFIFLPRGDSGFKRFYSLKEVLAFLKRELLDTPPHLEEISKDLIEIGRQLSINTCPTKEDENVVKPLISKWKKLIAPIAI